ncbi:outer membrane beta-barrel protein [Roseivirga sp. 4D4]|uniref:outer membrane beta-barrel protein n=1 Tax=Roseivirga sp. 4D4 TaxID=1889784 RepID=UPI001112C8DB|nr:outer membrane beta-barrel protein [Roseivirga sp. 4D4]
MNHFTYTLRVLVVWLLFVLPVTSSGQTGTISTSFGSFRNTADNAYYIVFFNKENSAISETAKAELRNNNRGIEVIIEGEDFKLDEIETIVNDGIRFGNIDENKVIVIDASSASEASLAILEQNKFEPSMTLVFGEFNTEVYNKRPGRAQFYPVSALSNLNQFKDALDPSGIRRKWGFELGGKMIRNSVESDSIVRRSNKGLFHIDFQMGTWFLLSDQDIGNERFNIANNGRHYKLNLGYGLSDRLILQAGLGFSFKLPNEDKQRQALGTPVPGSSFSNQTRNQVILSPSIGMKYYFKKGKYKYYGILGYEHVSMELINFKVFTNTNGDIRDRRSTMSKETHGLRYGIGVEAPILPRVYMTLQFEGFKSQEFDSPVNGVTNYDNLNFNFGIGYKFGSPSIKTRRKHSKSEGKKR